MPTMRRRVQLTALAALGLMMTVAAPGGAGVQQPAPTGVSTTIEVVADGLNAPRGLVHDPGLRRVLVAEAGVVAENTGPCGFAERGLPFCLGHSGSIFEYSEAGAPARRIVTGLPSTALQIPGTSVVIGLHDVTLFEGRLTVAFGTLGNEPYRQSLGAGAALLGQIATVGGSGKLKPIADILTFIDQRYAPDHFEANPYGVITGSYGAAVANAGGPGPDRGNNLLLVRPSGSIVELAQFPERPSLTDPSIRIRAVPTTVARGPDGAFYVGELTGDPFFPGEARVWRVVPGQPASIHAQGFTTIIDLAFDEQGRLLVLQTSNDPFNTEMDGALIRVEPDGQRTVLASAGLNNPGGLVVAGNGVYYITTRIASGGGSGQLLKLHISG